MLSSLDLWSETILILMLCDLVNLCQSELHMDIADSILTTRRLGNIRPSGPRRLLVSFRSSATASDVLSRAKLLRQSSDSITAGFIYLNRYLSFEEACLNYMKRMSRRGMQQAPTVPRPPCPPLIQPIHSQQSAQSNANSWADSSVGSRTGRVVGGGSGFTAPAASTVSGGGLTAGRGGRPAYSRSRLGGGRS